MGETGVLQSTGSQIVRPNLVTEKQQSGALMGPGIVSVPTNKPEIYYKAQGTGWSI